MTPHTEAALRGDLELLNRTVAEAVGFRLYDWPSDSLDRSDRYRIINPSGEPSVIGWPTVRLAFKEGSPNFIGSLDACRTFEAGMTEEEAWEFGCKLLDIAYNKNVYMWQLEPEDHCIALCYLRNVITPTTPQ